MYDILYWVMVVVLFAAGWGLRCEHKRANELQAKNEDLLETIRQRGATFGPGRHELNEFEGRIENITILPGADFHITVPPTR